MHQTKNQKKKGGAHPQRTTKQSIMKATITFPKREQAERFATTWARKTKTGHIIGTGMENVEVTVFDITEESKVFIDTFIESLNTEILNELN